MQHQKGHQASSVKRNLGFQDSGDQPLLEPETRAFGRVLDAKGSRGPVGDAEGLPLVGRALFSCTVVNLKQGLPSLSAFKLPDLQFSIHSCQVKKVVLTSGVDLFQKSSGSLGRWQKPSLMWPCLLLSYRRRTT